MRTAATSDRPNVLTLVSEIHRRQWLDGKLVRHPESHFLDIQIDDLPLRQRIPQAGDLVTDLNRAWLGHVDEAVQALLGQHAHRPSATDASRSWSVGRAATSTAVQSRQHSSSARTP